METREHLWPSCDCRLAVVVVEGGETDEEAWRRHLSVHPEDRHADIRVFHRQPGGAPAMREPDHRQVRHNRK